MTTFFQPATKSAAKFAPQSVEIEEVSTLIYKGKPVPVTEVGKIMANLLNAHQQSAMHAVVKPEVSMPTAPRFGR